MTQFNISKTLLIGHWIPSHTYTHTNIQTLFVITRSPSQDFLKLQFFIAQVWFFNFWTIQQVFPFWLDLCCVIGLCDCFPVCKLHFPVRCFWMIFASMFLVRRWRLSNHHEKMDSKMRRECFKWIKLIPEVIEAFEISRLPLRIWTRPRKYHQLWDANGRELN